MKRNILIPGVAVVALGVALAALPSHSSMLQVPAPPEPSAQIRQDLPAPEARAFEISVGEGSWLGVETNEVTSARAKELKLPAERGVVLGKIMGDSPASKAGLKENDVVTEINGQRVEGASQFRRMIREIPAGRTAQLTVWRDGRAQSITVTMGQAEDGRHNWATRRPAHSLFACRICPKCRNCRKYASMATHSLSWRGRGWASMPKT